MGLSKDDYNKSVLGQMRKLGFNDNKPKVVITVGEPSDATSIGTYFNCDSINLGENESLLSFDSGEEIFQDILLANNPETDTRRVLEIISITKGTKTLSHIWLVERALGTKLEDDELAKEKIELLENETGSKAIYRCDGYSRVYRILKKNIYTMFFLCYNY